MHRKVAKAHSCLEQIGCTESQQRLEAVGYLCSDAARQKGKASRLTLDGVRAIRNLDYSYPRPFVPYVD